MYWSGQLKELPTPASLVAFEVAFSTLQVHPFQLLAVTKTIRGVRTSTLVSVSHFIKVALSTDRNKFNRHKCVPF